MPFKVDDVSQAQQTRHGIKEPAHAGSLRAVGVGLGHSLQRRPGATIQIAHKWQIEIQELVAHCSVQVDRRHAPGLAYGARAAGHRHVIEMRNAFGICEVGHKKFAAPESPIRAKSQAIHRHADDCALNVVVCHATGDVRVMMLHTDLRFDLVERQRVLGRQVFRVQIVSDHIRVKIEESLEVRDAVLE